jgi:hypothetical protein
VRACAHGLLERSLSISDVDAQMSGRRGPLGVSVEHHDHGVADLDFDMPDAAFGVEHA